MTDATQALFPVTPEEDRCDICCRPREQHVGSDLQCNETTYYRPMPAQSPCLPGDVGTAIEALTMAAEWFEDYARQHRAKQTADADAKAETNDERANFLRNTLAALTPSARTCDFNVCDGSGWFTGRVDGECACVCQGTTSALSGDAGEELRRQGQREGKAAVCQWLRNLSATVPPGTLHHAAGILADDFEQSELPSHQGAGG